MYNMHTHVKDFQVAHYIHKYIKISKQGFLDLPWSQ